MMPSNRRLKAFFLVVVLVVLLTLYVSASARQTRSSDFYTKTQDAIVASRQAKEAGLSESEIATGEDEMIKHRLKAAQDAAKVKAEEKAETYHGSEAKQKALKVAESLRDDPVKDENDDYVAPKSSKQSKSSGKKESGKGEKSVAGRILVKEDKEAVLKTKGDDDEEEEEPFREETADEQKAHAELSEILKKSPSMLIRFFRSGMEANMRQSSYSPRHTVHTRRKQNTSCSRSTRSRLHHTWWNSTYIRSDSNYKHISAHSQAARQCRIF